MVNRVCSLNVIRHCVLTASVVICLSIHLSAQDSLQGLHLRTLDDHSPFSPPASKEEWLKRKEVLKDQLKVSLGLVPFPKLAELNPIVHGDHQGDGFKVQKVIIETLPGLYLTGSLFTPTGDLPAKKLPAILSPHGHWIDGRMYRCTDKELGTLLASGAERFESAARNHIQARCIQLARMGCVAFAYDMLGNADNQQISIQRAHGYGNTSVNPESDDTRYLFYSPQAEMYEQNIMGIQAINSIRALDFLESLTYVDNTRIAITGASGGGTQSFITAALDDRIDAAFPAVMVSTGMQGGCTCENAPYIRTGTGNVEIAAMIAPRPMGMTAADDWTKNVAQDGYPELKSLYQLFGAQDQVSLLQATHFPHNYNHVARVAMYGFMNRVFGLGFNEPILERDFDYLTRDVLTVYDSQHPAPMSGMAFEQGLLKSWQNELDSYFKLPEAAKSDEYLQSAQGKDLIKGWDVITSLAEPWSKNSQAQYVWPLDEAQAQVVIKNSSQHVVGSGLLLTNGAVQRGKSALAKIDWNAVKKIEVYINETMPTDSAANDTLRIKLRIEDPLGETLLATDEQGLVPNPRPVAAYTYGYNAPSILRRTGVLLNLLDSIAASNDHLTITLHSVGSDNFLATAAAFRRPELVKTLKFGDADPFRFAAISSIRHKDFLPGALRYQDMPGLLLCASRSGVIVAGK